MTPIEILAVIFAVIILVKSIVTLVKPKKSVKTAAKFLENQALAIGIYVVMTVVVGYFAISALGIVNTFVASFFGLSLMGLSIVMYPKAVLKLARAVLKDRKKLILPLIIWVALAIWVLYTIFG